MTFMRPLIMSLCMAPGLAFAGSAQPERVVELFTSQGCSSCPPANDVITQVSDDGSTLALSYGVTYWDYLGWKDTFADPAFTLRQKKYGRLFEISHLYTPQIVLNGASHGSRYSERDIHSMDLPDARPVLTLSRHDDTLIADIDETSDSFVPVVVEYVPGPQTVPVERGENGGRALTISNVVTDVQTLDIWDSEAMSQFLVRSDLAPGKAYALLLHDRETGKIRSAATFTAE